MALFSEFKRRKVFNVMAAYAVVSWLLVQIMVEIEEPLSLPPWSDTLVIVLLAFGFPIAIILSWALDITPEGVVRTESLPKEEQAGSEEARPGSPQTIAVLPFESIATSAEDNYLASGIHGELLNQLARVQSLRVIARTSVQQFAQTDKSIQQIAHDLNAGTIVEGTVQVANGRVRISAQLIDARESTHLWAESYDRDIQDVFEIQSDIAGRIARSLTDRLSPEEEQSIESAPTASGDSYAIFLRAMAIYREDDSATGAIAPPAKRMAIQSLLDEAIYIDPDFALAHAWKAWIYTFSRAYDPVSAGDWLTRSADFDSRIADNAGRALSLDNGLGLAHAAMGKLHLYNWRSEQAQASFAQALLVSGRDPEVLRWCSNFHWFIEDNAAAVELAGRAVELDPQHTAYYDLLGRVSHSSGDYAAAAESFRRGIELNPGAAIDYVSLARALLASGDEAGAEAALNTANELMPTDASPGLQADLANGLARVGAQEIVDTVLERIRRASQESYVDPAVWTLAYLAERDHAKALEQLQSAVDNRALIANPFAVMFIRQNAWSDPALEEPQFKPLRDSLSFSV